MYIVVSGLNETFGPYTSWATANRERVRHPDTCIRKVVDGKSVCACAEHRNAVVKANNDTTETVGLMVRRLTLRMSN